MRKKLIAAATLCGASTAAGAVTMTSLAGSPDPGMALDERILLDFNNGLPTGVTATGDYRIAAGSVAGIRATPAGNSQSNPYLSVPQDNASGSVTLDFSAYLMAANSTRIRSISFYWGSIDSFNKVELLNGNTVFSTLLGSQLPQSNGDQSSPTANRRVFFTINEADPALTGMRLVSNGRAFEIDDVAIATMPEPATLGLLGLGLLAVARRRDQGVTSSSDRSR